MCILMFKNLELVPNAFSMNVEEKKEKNFAEKSHSVFKGFKGAPSYTLKKFVRKVFFIFFFNIY